VWNNGRDISGILAASLLDLPSAWVNTFLGHSRNLHCLTFLIQEIWPKAKTKIDSKRDRVKLLPLASFDSAHSWMCTLQGN
jgi:hypothetical protein